MHRPHRSDNPHAHEALARVRREGRWWWLQARHTRRIWRWAVLGAVVLFVLLAVFRRPLADWFWAEPRIEQLIEQGDHALAAGRLSAPDGSGAREYYQAALALDGDRGAARAGLARTGDAALQAARSALQRNALDTAAEALQLARQLQVPQARSDAIALQLRERRAAGAGLDALLQQARTALAAHRLDGDADSALPIVQQVLELRPQELAALELREDALSDLLLQARQASGEGEVVRAADLVRRARGYDPGHADLPASQEALSRALETRVRATATALRRGRLDAAVTQFAPALQAAADDALVAAMRERLVAELLQDSRARAADYDFTTALQRIDQAAVLQGSPRELASVRQDLERARAARHAMPQASGAGTVAGKRRLDRLLSQVAEAESEGRLISPPGASAYDALREAQALAPVDRRVAAAAARLLPAGRQCFEQALMQNRVEAAGACLQAWQALAPGGAGIATARNRLAQRWLAVGSERLGRGDLAFAEHAAVQARQLQPSLSELTAFEARVQQAGGLQP